MARFRGYLATFAEVDADNEGIAEKLIQEQLVNNIRRGESGLIVWEINPPSAAGGVKP